jgi:hypothetical protein
LSQSRYPLKTVINGDSVVILTKGQADTINNIFDSQKQKIADAKELISFKDSLIRSKDSLLGFKDSLLKLTNFALVRYDSLNANYINTLMFLDYVESWVYDRAKEGSFLYYSYDSTCIEAIDLSDYEVRKNDYTGAIFFYRITDTPFVHKKKNDSFRKGWEQEITRTNRPKIHRL